MLISCTPNSLHHRLHRPIIIVNTSFEYQGSSWGDQYDVRGNHITIPGDGNFAVELDFAAPIDSSSLAGRILLNGEQVTPTSMTVSGTVVYMHFPNARTGESYEFILSKGIKETGGRELPTDITFKIELQKTTYAHYSLQGAGSYHGEMGSTYKKEQLLTTHPKTLIIDFTQTVNQSSVETTLRNCLVGKAAKIGFSWVSEQKLHLSISELALGDYALLLSQAKDYKGHKIIGDLYFQVSEPNELRYYDVTTGKSELVLELPERIFKPIGSDVIGRYVLVEDQGWPRVIDLESRTITPEPVMKRGWLWMFARRALWLDQHTLLYADPPKVTASGPGWFSTSTEGCNFNKYSLEKKSAEVLFPFDKGPSMPTQAIVSPMGTKLAIAAIDHDEGQVKVDLYVYDRNGYLIIHEPGRLKYPHDVFLAWLDDEHLVVEGFDGSLTNLYSVNISTLEREVLLEKTTGIAASRDGIIIFRRPLENKYYMLCDGIEIPIPIDTLWPSNIYLLKDGVLAYNNDDAIMISTTGSNDVQQVGKGFVIGSSTDLTRLYYLTNTIMP